MICPFCGQENIDGVDLCESCKEDLSSLDGVQPQSELERSLMEDPILKIPPREAICLAKETSIHETARQMNQHRVGCILITESGKLIGIATERDILYKATQKIDGDLGQIPISSIMTPNPETLLEGDTIAYALNRMSVGGFRHIPILKNGTVAGLISAPDILGYLVNHLS